MLYYFLYEHSFLFLTLPYLFEETFESRLKICRVAPLGRYHKNIFRISLHLNYRIINIVTQESNLTDILSLKALFQLNSVIDI
jgi:hypothetical protein